MIKAIIKNFIMNEIIYIKLLYETSHSLNKKKTLINKSIKMLI